ncbi:MAG: DarT ssDNA thymidine ADP-ribosyltransferase family protein [Spirulinaceae cyanobacterium]
MNEIAKVRWFNNSHKNQCKLECEDGSRYSFSSDEIHCSIKNLRRGRFITFELTGNTLKNLRLLREIGVMEWYNSDKGFGVAKLLRDDLTSMFASHHKGYAEVFVHINQVCSGSENIEEGSLVVFEIKTNQKSSNNHNNSKEREDATQIKLLTQETNKEVIEWCANSDDVNIVSIISRKYLDNFESLDQKVSWALEKLNQLTDHKKSQFANSLPSEILIASSEIQEYLPPIKYIEILVKLIEEDAQNGKINQASLLKKLQTKLETNFIKNTKYSDIWSKIPDWILLRESIWSLVPDSHSDTIIRSQINDEFNRERGICLLQNKLKDYLEDFQNLSPAKRIKILQGSDPLCLFSMLDEPPEIFEFLSTIPDSIKENEKIFSYLPPEEQIKIFSKRLENTLLSAIELVSQESFLFMERQTLISKLPEWVKAHPSFPSFSIKISDATSRSDDIEADKIKQLVSKRGIERIVHLTKLSNLRNICNSGGILSLYNLSSNNIVYNPFDGKKPEGPQYENYVNCSLTYYNFVMFYGLVNQSFNSVILLHIKPDYLWKQGTKFCQVNAATDHGSRIGSGYDTLNSLFDYMVEDTEVDQDRDNDKPDNVPTCIQAEILIKDGIPIDDILEIIVHDPDDCGKVRQAGWKGNVRHSSSLFEYRRGWHLKVPKRGQRRWFT